MEYKISVIIPVYKVEDYIKDCLESVVNQTLGINNIEVIIVNDCTPDNSMDIVNEYAEKYPSFKIINHEKNKGLGESRNTGLKNVSTDYVTFLDSDDFISKNTYKDSLLKIKESNSDLLIYNWEFFLENGEKEPRSIHQPNFTKNKTILNLKEDYNILFLTSAWNKIFSKRLFKYLNFPSSLYEDNISVIEAMLNSKKIYLSKDSTYYYRKNHDSLSRDISIKNPLELSTIIKKLFELSNKYPDYSNNLNLLILKFTNDILFWIYYYDWFIDDEKKIFNKLKSSVKAFSKENIDHFKKIFPNYPLYSEDILNIKNYDDETFLAKYKYFKPLAKVNPTANLYINTGNSFNEHEKIAINYNLQETNILAFNLESFKNIINLRFDPIEGAFVKVNIKNDSNFIISSANCDNSLNDDYQVFTNLDPSYVIEGEFNSISSIKFIFKLAILNDKDLNSLFEDKNNIINSLKKEIEDIKSNSKKGLFSFKR